MTDEDGLARTGRGETGQSRKVVQQTKINGSHATLKDLPSIRLRGESECSAPPPGGVDLQLVVKRRSRRRARLAASESTIVDHLHVEDDLVKGEGEGSRGIGGADANKTSRRCQLCGEMIKRPMWRKKPGQIDA